MINKVDVLSYFISLLFIVYDNFDVGLYYFSK